MTLNELVAHSHPITNGNGVYTWDATSGAATVSVLIETTTNNTKPVNISVGNRGGGQAMDILQTPTLLRTSSYGPCKTRMLTVLIFSAGLWAVHKPMH